MKIVVVGQSNGRRQIRWGSALLVSCVMGLFCALVATTTYFGLTRTLSAPVAILGFFGPFITIGCGIQRALQLPIEQLTPLDVDGRDA